MLYPKDPIQEFAMACHHAGGNHRRLTSSPNRI